MIANKDNEDRLLTKRPVAGLKLKDFIKFFKHECLTDAI